VSGVASHHTTEGSQPVGKEVALIRMTGGWGACAPPAWHEVIGKPLFTCGKYLGECGGGERPHRPRFAEEARSLLIPVSVSAHGSPHSPEPLSTSVLRTETDHAAQLRLSRRSSPPASHTLQEALR
jgi:hypothetical protein